MVRESGPGPVERSKKKPTQPEPGSEAYFRLMAQDFRNRETADKQIELHQQKKQAADRRQANRASARLVKYYTEKEGKIPSAELLLEAQRNIDPEIAKQKLRDGLAEVAPEVLQREKEEEEKMKEERWKIGTLKRYSSREQRPEISFTRDGGRQALKYLLEPAGLDQAAQEEIRVQLQRSSFENGIELLGAKSPTAIVNADTYLRNFAADQVSLTVAEKFLDGEEKKNRHEYEGLCDVLKSYDENVLLPSYRELLKNPDIDTVIGMVGWKEFHLNPIESKDDIKNPLTLKLFDKFESLALTAEAIREARKGLDALGLRDDREEAVA